VRSAHIKGVHQAGGVGGDGGAMPHHTACKKVGDGRAQHEIIGDAIGLDHPVFMAIFRNVGHAAFGQLPWRGAGDIYPVQCDAASHWVP
jgi:hypothetical protein